ncbi:hypothetical protein I317_02506 [Kwoniella heveanensis CBS 569]|nr:hypothetical protein I317_02506 [Kwoniella heveanensis CBS 569]
MPLSYEEQRLKNIRDNEALLLSLGLSAPSTKPKPRAAPGTSKNANKVKTAGSKSVLSSKRSNVSTDAEDASDGTTTPRRPHKIRKVTEESEEGTPVSGLRRSARSSARSTPDYVGRQTLYVEIPTKSNRQRRREDDGEGSENDEAYEAERDRELMRRAQKLGVRTQDPKTFGHIPGVEVGTWWATSPTVAGISGNALEGAYSVALSGGYPDDVDLGYAFTYTGSGGRDLKGTKQKPKNLRTAPQTYDQSFDNTFNAALKRSAETKLPVRVIRGFKLPSLYAPETGYRYDGLYVVEKAWMAKGLTKGLKVCRYAFKRVEGQSELPMRSEEEAEEDEGEQEEADTNGHD